MVKQFLNVSACFPVDGLFGQRTFPVNETAMFPVSCTVKVMLDLHCLSVSFTSTWLFSLHGKTCSAHRDINPHATYLQSLMLNRECPFMVQGTYRETSWHSQKMFYQQGSLLACFAYLIYFLRIIKQYVLCIGNLGKSKYYQTGKY